MLLSWHRCCEVKSILDSDSGLHARGSCLMRTAADDRETGEACYSACSGLTPQRLCKALGTLPVNHQTMASVQSIMILTLVGGATLFRSARELFVLSQGWLRNEVTGVWDSLTLLPRAGF
jgi:hypothetical protein